MFTATRRQSTGLLVVVAALLLLAANASARTVATTASSDSAAVTSVSRINEFKDLAAKHGAFVPRVGIAKIDPNVIREIEASAATISIYLVTPDYLFENRPAYNTTCTAQSTGTVYTPNQVSMILPYASFTGLPNDIYECVVDQPGYYRFTEIINTTATAGTLRYLHLVPVSYGVTIIYNVRNFCSLRSAKPRHDRFRATVASDFFSHLCAGLKDLWVQLRFLPSKLLF